VVKLAELSSFPNRSSYGRFGANIVSYIFRITMPNSHVHLSAGRDVMSEEMQPLCFLAGANLIFYGETLLTTGNQDAGNDLKLFKKPGIRPEETPVPSSRSMANA
jgi:biotin synthase